MTRDERQAALEAIASEVRACTMCRLAETRTCAVPGEGDPDTEVVFVGEGPGFNEDREGRPFVGRAGGFLVRLLASVGWRRDDVFITNVVKCRPPDNRDPQADEIAACEPFLRRQLEILDPAVVVTLGRYSMAAFIPDARIGQVHGTTRPVSPDTGAADALVFAMYHPAAALRSAGVERDSLEDMQRVPGVLLRARELRAEHAVARHAGGVTAAPGIVPAATMPVGGPLPDTAPTADPPATAGPRQPADPGQVAGQPAATATTLATADPAADEASQLTLF